VRLRARTKRCGAQRLSGWGDAQDVTNTESASVCSYRRWNGSGLRVALRRPQQMLLRSHERFKVWIRGRPTNPCWLVRARSVRHVLPITRFRHTPTVSLSPTHPHSAVEQKHPRLRPPPAGRLGPRLSAPLFIRGRPALAAGAGGRRRLARWTHKHKRRGGGGEPRRQGVLLLDAAAPQRKLPHPLPPKGDPLTPTHREDLPTPSQPPTATTFLFALRPLSGKRTRSRSWRSPLQARRRCGETAAPERDSTLARAVSVSSHHSPADRDGSLSTRSFKHNHCRRYGACAAH
jgi:hypothetical protein